MHVEPFRKFFDIDTKILTFCWHGQFLRYWNAWFGTDSTLPRWAFDAKVDFSFFRWAALVSGFFQLFLRLVCFFKASTWDVYACRNRFLAGQMSPRTARVAGVILHELVFPYRRFLDKDLKGSKIVSIFEKCKLLRLQNRANLCSKIEVRIFAVLFILMFSICKFSVLLQRCFFMYQTVYKWSKVWHFWSIFVCLQN